ncbi:hypothetical protein [Rheinheimera texasensis]|uniref:hypothetical protein n=1 Tax=Rheinheimera texasensis TaxID=306205 RepID=UPI0004E0BC46|nr:hypothetical protein [Rheinheimera texasensis]
MLGLSLWVLWPALLVCGLDLWLFRRLDWRSLLLGTAWVLLMLLMVMSMAALQPANVLQTVGGQSPL